MKFENEYWLILVVVVTIIIFNAMTASSYFSPYHPLNYFSREFPFEGFEPKGEKNIAKDGSVDYVLDGIPGFYGPPESHKKVDEISTKQGSKDIQPTNLTTSTGWIRIDDEMKKMFETRGGNA
jgi:hypothetical protein